jgi:hypothetical protein
VSPVSYEISDAALLEQPGVELPGRGQLDEVARHDEDQFATGLEVAHALLDEEQEEVAARIEKPGFQAFPGVDRDILKTHVGRVADDGLELLGQRVVEKIADLGAGRRDARVDLDADAIRVPLPEQFKEDAVTGRRLKRPPAVAAQGEHEFHDLGRREHLAESNYVLLAHEATYSGM